jgi:glycosyltransferase involved in cell wall biosynthesis
VLVVQRSREPHAEYARDLGGSCEVIDLSEAQTESDLLARINTFAPDVTLVTTNKDARYHAVARDNHRQGRITVWGSEIPPRSVWRDSYGMIRGRMGSLRDYDAALVAGKASHEYARRVGFPEDRIVEGLLTCDTDLFRPIGIARHRPTVADAWPRVFLFVGQFIPRKGLDVLLEAYRRYRGAAPDAWELWCAGAGPLRETLVGQPGVRVLDFVPPAECARLMGQAGAFVLPSRIDHWGIVIHEATCAGLPVIASRTSYASADLVQDGSNGYTFSAADVEGLARLLAMCADEPRARLMGQRSLALSDRFDPGIFARLLTEDIPRMVRR